jgi:hypothetical protein
MSLFGALEAGGTKCVCAVGSEVDHMLARTVIPTTSGCIDLAGSDIDIDHLIVPSELSGNAGIAGAFELARGGA